ncbi:PEPxxWA-CTERM sorting domain-containing protein [uncultured Sphingomonas sp.]|uniref:PEPxxWA-CTERM sorting domain-containing protein n=1 Tax=uncultured Sphingomonas sp. TaxID=158754 RepID=UPI0035CC9848
MNKMVWGALIVAVWAAPAAADIDNTVLEGDVRLGAGNLIQMGRLGRNNMAGQDFAGSEAFPGTNNPTVQYHYTTFAAAFAPNALQDIYYSIVFDDDAADLFASAYNGSYDPTSKATNWLGDAGRSGNYIFYPGLPGDALFFGVKVAKGGSLTLVVNDTVAGLGTSSSAHYLIQAFSDSEYGTDFLTASVPEPASWAMMVAGFGAVGGAVRYRRRRARLAFA